MQLRGPAGGGVWARETIADEHGGRWHVDAWIAPRSGRLVLGELRVLPAVDGKPGEPWLLDPEKVPRRGLERRVLQHKVPVGRFVPQVFAQLSEAEGLRAQGYKGPISVPVLVSTTLLALLPGIRALVRRPRARRSVGRDDDFYARLAAQYVERISAGSITPVKDIADQRSDTTAHIRDLLHEARERGLLTKGTTGKSAGALTPRALAVLKQDAKATPRRPRR
jgi:hypothetical protein